MKTFQIAFLLRIKLYSQECNTLYCNVAGEDLSVAAAREVLEETGVVTEFVSVVAARHSHAAAFSCSDLYFVVLMRPTTALITMCTQELSACQWMQVSACNAPRHCPHHHVYAGALRLSVDAGQCDSLRDVSCASTVLPLSVFQIFSSLVPYVWLYNNIP